MRRDHGRELAEMRSWIVQIEKGLSDLKGYIDSSCYGSTDHSIGMAVSAETLLLKVTACFEVVKKCKK